MYKKKTKFSALQQGQSLRFVSEVSELPMMVDFVPITPASQGLSCHAILNLKNQPQDEILPVFSYHEAQTLKSALEAQKLKRRNFSALQRSTLALLYHRLAGGSTNLSHLQQDNSLTIDLRKICLK